MALKLSILGALGKMGERVIQLASEDPHFEIVSGLSRNHCQQKTLPFSMKNSAEDAMKDCDVAIDFSSAQATLLHIETALKLQKALVIGTTGLKEEALQSMQIAAKQIPILYSPNFSLGMALCLETAKKLGAALFGHCHIDIVEAHHIHKKDSPSGTALALAKAIGQGEILTNPQSNRTQDQIVIHSIRTGNAIGEHKIIFELGLERIELTHQAHSRDAFAKGALIAASFLANQKPGLYSISDLFRV